MGKKADQQRRLEVKIPTFFRCPISLEIMKSPVSLCTGVTYDRSSIQRWLDEGNTTCPATMQSLSSTDLIPNHTLHRLIRLWAASINSSSTSSTVTDAAAASDILSDLKSAADPVPVLRRLAAFFSDADADDFAKNSLVSGGGCASALASLFSTSAKEAAIEIFAQIQSADWIEPGNKQLMNSAISADLHQSVSAAIDVMKNSGRIESRIAAAKVLDLLSTPAEAAVGIAEAPDLIGETIRLIGPAGDGKDGRIDPRAAEAGLAVLDSLLAVRRARVVMVRMGAVLAVARALAVETVTARAAEKGMRVMAAAAGCAEGREAICGEAELCVGAVMGRMMKAGKEGTEAAVVVLWSVCHRFRDRRAVEAVAAGSGGGITKFLLLMQGYCSPTTRQMAGDLMRIFKVSSKSCLNGYDTKTTHIMPF